MERNDERIGRIEHEVPILIRRAMSVKGLGSLDRSAYLLLRQIKEQGPLGVKALADEFHLDISTVSRQVASLEVKGFVERFSDPNDGRASLFRLTDVGLARLEETRETRLARFSQLLTNWTPDELQIFGELLARLNRTFLD